MRGGSSCSSRPFDITPTRSATASASCWSWVTNTVGHAELPLHAADLVAQRLAYLRRRGPTAARPAAAAAAAWRAPGPGRRAASGRRRAGADLRSRAAVRPVTSSRPSTVDVRSEGAILRSRRPNSMLARAVMFGNSRYSWNTMPKPRFSVGVRVMSVPPTSTWPSVRALEARQDARRGRLPQPDGPEQGTSSARLDLQVERLQRHRRPERLPHAARIDTAVHQPPTPPVSRRCRAGAVEAHDKPEQQRCQDHRRPAPARCRPEPHPAGS